MATNEARITVEVIGLRPLIEGLERATEALREHEQRLIAMGWTETMAREFLAEIAEVIIREISRDLKVVLEA